MTLRPDPAPVDHAIASRRSVRAFTDEAVPRQMVEAILDVARQAPSGTNMQPWRAYVATGETLKRLTEATVRAAMDPAFEKEARWKYYPDTFPEPYLARRRAVGFG